MPPDMPRTPRFSIADLSGIFFSVFERYANQVDVQINLGRDLAALADQLDAITSSLDVSDNLGAMAYIMTAVTVKVFNGAPITFASTVDQMVNALTWKIRIELSVECAIYFAQIHGYPISPAQVAHEQVAGIMLTDDQWRRRVILTNDQWRQLSGIFEHSLVAASLAAGPPKIEDDPNRQLSTESYANLRSEAFQRGWTNADIVRLIEEHLRPKLNPFVVNYSDTVSGEEWLDLYNWVRRRDGRSL
jgi:hypothetical protein